MFDDVTRGARGRNGTWHVGSGLPPITGQFLKVTVTKDGTRGLALATMEPSAETSAR